MTPQKLSAGEYHGEAEEIYNLVVSLARLKKLLGSACAQRLLNSRKEPLFKDVIRG